MMAHASNGGATMLKSSAESYQEIADRLVPLLPTDPYDRVDEWLARNVT
jgi:hypothetical protein